MVDLQDRRSLLYRKVSMYIQFLGATQTVTGSKYLIQIEKDNPILIDCGLFQGYKELRLRNWAKLPLNPSSIKNVLLTHAHIDHSGYIPLLIKNGFRGKIYCTESTYQLCEILLPDSGYLHEEEAYYANKKGYSKHHPALPLYTKEDAIESLNYFHPITYNKPYEIQNEIIASFHPAGHILGSAFIRIECQDKSILFTGDLGRTIDPILKPAHPPISSDYLVVESTYGNRLHEENSPEQQLNDIINKTVKRGGVIIIPAFAVGRTQTLLYYIQQLKEKKKISDIPVFVDSPMATNVTELFSRHDDECRLNDSQCMEVCNVAQYIRTVDESKALGKHKSPMIIISASGMATGGRVLHHIINFASNERNTILFTGFQAGGTRGHRIINNEKEIKMFGQMVPINAEIIQMENMSAHADYSEMLTWLGKIKTPPKKVFITHGEKEAAESLQQKIQQQLQWPCSIPGYLDKNEL